MKATGSASLLSRAPAGFCSHLLEAAISVMVGTLSQEEREERKKERRREGGSKDPKSAAIDFPFLPGAPTGQHRIMPRGRTTEEGQKCRARKMPKKRAQK